MKVLIFETAEAAEYAVAEIVASEVSTRPETVLGLATGGTMLPVYARLCALRSEGLSFAKVTSFNLDEYVGLSSQHPESYHSYMREVLFDHIDILPENCHLPKGDAVDVRAECLAYEENILAQGGIDLQLLGIGRNGHIGFNEPSSSLGSLTRVKTLTESTRQANAPYFTDQDAPKYAITMGIRTILNARTCVLLATGAAKSQAVAQAVEGPLSAICPASALQMHAETTVVLDRSAATELRHRDYYAQVHPHGAEHAL
ncbi:MAG: glucosamine-6-phosphate deaminase [Pelagimonas sp.]